MGSIHFLIQCFCSDFRSSDSMHKPFKGSFCCCCSLQFYSFPGCILHWVSKSGVLEVHLSYAGSRGLGCLMWSLNPSFLREMIHIFVIPSVGGLLSLEFFLGEHISYPSRCCPFACGCGSCVHPLFRFISMGNFPHIVSALLCLWEEVSSGSSYITILNCLPGVFLSYCLYFCFYSLGFIFHVMDQMTGVSYEFHPPPNPNLSEILSISSKEKFW